MNARRQGAVVAVLAVVAFAAALAGQLVYDDIHSIATNPVLHDPKAAWRWLSDPGAFSEQGRMYRPVVLLSLGSTLALSAAPCWLKLGNLLLHAACAWLAFGWLRRLGGRRLAFPVAALFAVHPLLGEAVNLVSARSELLMVLGTLVALRAQHARSGLGAAVGTALGTALACGSKETGVVVPALLLAQAFVLRRGSFDRAFARRALRSALPAIAVAVGYLLLRRALLGEATVTLAGRVDSDPLSGHGRSVATQLATMGLLLPRAVWQMVFPVGLSLDPEVTFRSSFLDPLVLAGWVGVLGLVGVGVVPGPAVRVRRLGAVVMVATALAWVVIPLNVPLAEHRLYGPTLGFLCIVAPWLPRLRARPVWLFGLCLLGIVLGNLRSLDYRDEVALWRAEIARNPLSFRAQWGLGAACLRDGRVADAVEPLARTVVLAPRELGPWRNYTEALVWLPDAAAQPWRAVATAQRYLAARPQDPWARALCAQASLQAGHVLGGERWFAAAERQALSCLEVGEPKALVFRLAAAACLGRGDLAGALAHLDRAVAQGLAIVGVRLDRAEVLRELGRPADAQRELRLAQQLAPLDPAVLTALRAAPPR